MRFFTEIADGFERIVHDDEVFLDRDGTEAASNYLKEGGVVNLLNVGSAGLTYAGFTFISSVAKGFVDVLRLGDGVKKGGWGYGEDALRALAIAGPAFRSVRWAAGLVAGVDAETSLGNCAWVAGARATRLASMRLFTTVADLAKGMKIPIEQTDALNIAELKTVMDRAGVATKLSRNQLRSMAEVAREAANAKDGVVVFGIYWISKRRPAGHALVARWGLTGIKIIDRSGKVVRSLVELEPYYPNIGIAQPIGQALIIPNSIAIRALGTIPSLLNIIAIAVIPALVRERIITPNGGGVKPQVPPRQKAPPAANPSSYKGPVEQRTCIRLNSDSPESCRSYYTYTIAPGDNLSSIAKRIYGNERYWRHIYQWNKAVLGPNPQVLSGFKVGTELVLPSK